MSYPDEWTPGDERLRIFIPSWTTFPLVDPDLAPGMQIMVGQPTTAAAFSAFLKNRALQNEVARMDVFPWLTTWFRPEPEQPASDSWVADPVLAGPIGDPGDPDDPDDLGTATSVVVVWTFHGRHDQDGTFQGTPASRRSVTVRGASFFTHDEPNQKLQVRRFVDWTGLYAQLGLTLDWRMPMPQEGRNA